MVQFIDLGAQYARIKTEVEAAALRSLRSGQHIMGPEIEALENNLAAFVGVKHAISCASGTDALVMALMAKGVGPGDAVFTVPFTFMASAEAIATVGATPIFVDVDPVTFNIAPEALERAVKALLTGDGSIHPLPAMEPAELQALRPKGIIAVDLFGIPADYAAINAIAAEHGLFVIEDAAQSLGASAFNQRSGSLAEIGCTSFFPAKPLGCYGDGGAIFTNDPEIAHLLKSIRVHGQGDDKYENVRIGITGRLDAIQAAILNVKLGIFEDELGERQRVAARYASKILESGLALIPPTVPDHHSSAWAQYSVLAQDKAGRDIFLARLAAAGIPSAIYYPKSLHLQRAFAPLGYSAGDFAVSEDLSTRIFALPMHPYLTNAEVDTVVAGLGAS